MTALRAVSDTHVCDVSASRSKLRLSTQTVTYTSMRMRQARRTAGVHVHASTLQHLREAAAKCQSGAPSPRLPASPYSPGACKRKRPCRCPDRHRYPTARCQLLSLAATNRAGAQDARRCWLLGRAAGKSPCNLKQVGPSQKDQKLV